MDHIDKLLERFRRNPRNARFDDVASVCERYFGVPRIHGSHHVYKMPWEGDPRINIQNRNGFVAPYQVRQVLAAVDKCEREGDGH